MFGPNRTKRPVQPLKWKQNNLMKRVFQELDHEGMYPDQSIKRDRSRFWGRTSWMNLVVSMWKWVTRNLFSGEGSISGRKPPDAWWTVYKEALVISQWEGSFTFIFQLHTHYFLSKRPPFEWIPQYIVKGMGGSRTLWKGGGSNWINRGSNIQCWCTIEGQSPNTTP